MGLLRKEKNLSVNPRHKSIWSWSYQVSIEKKEGRVVCYGYCHFIEEEASKGANLRLIDHIRKGLKLGFLKAYLDCLSLFVACCLLHSIKSKNIQRETKILHRNYQCFKGIFLMYVRCYSYCIPTL